MLTIRDAQAADDAAILAITNREIREDVNNWALEEIGAADVALWREDERFPLIVAALGGEVVGFGKYGSFRAKEGYRQTVEHTVYVSPKAQRRGVGRALLAALIERAEAAGDVHIMVGGIEAGNAPSLALHKALGFEEVGRMPQVGHKFGRWLDLVFVQRGTSKDIASLTKVNR